MVSILSRVESITLEHDLEAKIIGRDAVTPFKSIRNSSLFPATEEEHDGVRVNF